MGKLSPCRWLVLGFLATCSVVCVTRTPAALTTNSWIAGNGKWEAAANWSAGAPSSANAASLITNAATKTVTIDAATTNTATMTISNLTLSAPGTDVNTLQLTNTGTATPLRILNNFTVGTNAVLQVTNSVLRVEGLSGGTFTVDGSVTNLAGGQIYSTNVSLSIGSTAAGRGNFTTMGGLLQVSNNVIIAAVAGSQGALNVAGGTNTITANLAIANSATATGAVWVTTGGQLVVTNGNLIIGNLGVGQLTVSNGTLLARQIQLGPNAGSGTLTVAGGTNTLLGDLMIDGVSANSAVWVTGGQLVVTNGVTTVAVTGLCQMTISNGTVFCGAVTVGDQSFGGGIGTGGTLTMVGGTNIVSGTLTLGHQIAATGSVFVTGGLLVVTNNPTILGSNGVGQATVSGGEWRVRDMIVGLNAGSRGALTLAGAAQLLPTVLTIGSNANSAGSVWVTGGSAQLVATNTVAVIGGSGAGQLTLSNGSVLARDMTLGYNAGSTGNLAVAGGTLVTTNGTITLGFIGAGQMLVSQGTVLGQDIEVGGFGAGTLTVAGGTNALAGQLLIANATGSTGTVWVTGGRLIATNAPTQLGNGGVGRMTVSNGTFLALVVNVGGSPGSPGTLTVAGGTNVIANTFAVGNAVGSTGTVWLTGGLLLATNFQTTVGNASAGQMTVSNGTLVSTSVSVGFGVGSQGTLTMAGGTNSIYNILTIGAAPCSATGTVLIAGGALYVTNATGNAVLEVRTGTLTLGFGTLTVERFVMTNACAHFVHTGGSLIYGTAVLDPNRDDDGDGIPNGYEQSHGLDPLNVADASLDFDGDGMSNLQEYLAGTDPNDPNSIFRITSVLRTNTNFLITWTMGPGKTNALQSTAGAGNGSYQTNNFTDLFTVTNTVGTVTNYLDVGGATNFPARYYRVRLVP